jgi:hypothetical protein
VVLSNIEDKKVYSTEKKWPFSEFLNSVNSKLLNQPDKFLAKLHNIGTIFTDFIRHDP